MLKSIEKDMEVEKAFEDGYAKGREEGRSILAEVEGKLSEKCCSLADENRKLREENESLKTELFRLSAQADVLRAQMDVVYLIFGGK